MALLEKLVDLDGWSKEVSLRMPPDDIESEEKLCAAGAILGGGGKSYSTVSHPSTTVGGLEREHPSCCLPFLGYWCLLDCMPVIPANECAVCKFRGGKLPVLKAESRWLFTEGCANVDAVGSLHGVALLGGMLPHRACGFAAAFACLGESFICLR